MISEQKKTPTIDQDRLTYCSPSIEWNNITVLYQKQQLVRGSRKCNIFFFFRFKLKCHNPIQSSFCFDLKKKICFRFERVTCLFSGMKFMTREKEKLEKKDRKKGRKW